MNVAETGAWVCFAGVLRVPHILKQVFLSWLRSHETWGYYEILQILQGIFSVPVGTGSSISIKASPECHRMGWDGPTVDLPDASASFSHIRRFGICPSELRKRLGGNPTTG